jgi:hypothetical protein
VFVLLDVARHAPRVIKLTYEGEGSIDTTLMLVGKVILLTAWFAVLLNHQMLFFMVSCLLLRVSMQKVHN